MAHIEIFEKKVKEGLVRITQVSDSIELGFVESILHSEGIETTVNRGGSGSYLNVYAGFNFQGIDIFIHEEDYEKAKDILSNVEMEHSKDDEEYKALEEEYKASKEKKRRWILLTFIPIILFLGALIVSQIIK